MQLEFADPLVYNNTLVEFADSYGIEPYGLLITIQKSMIFARNFNMNYERGIGFGKLTFELDGVKALEKFKTDNC